MFDRALNTLLYPQGIISWTEILQKKLKSYIQSLIGSFDFNVIGQISSIVPANFQCLFKILVVHLTEGRGGSLLYMNFHHHKWNKQNSVNKRIYMTQSR